MQAKNKQLFQYQGLESDLDQEAVVMLGKLFFEDTGTILAQIDEAIAAKNSEEVRMLVHMLKGCCRSISAFSVEEFCEALEGAAMKADWPSITVGVSALGPLYSQLSDEISAYLASHS